MAASSDYARRWGECCRSRRCPGRGPSGGLRPAWTPPAGGWGWPLSRNEPALVRTLWVWARGAGVLVGLASIRRGGAAACGRRARPRGGGAARRPGHRPGLGRRRVNGVVCAQGAVSWDLAERSRHMLGAGGVDLVAGTLCRSTGASPSIGTLTISRSRPTPPASATSIRDTAKPGRAGSARRRHIHRIAIYPAEQCGPSNRVRLMATWPRSAACWRPRSSPAGRDRRRRVWSGAVRDASNRFRWLLPVRGRWPAGSPARRPVRE